MKLYSNDGQIFLDPAPLSAEELQRNRTFKMQCRRYVAARGAGAAGSSPAGQAAAAPATAIELKSPGNHVEFERMVERLRAAAERMGTSLEVDPALEGYYAGMRELAEERSRLGNEIKRADPKHQARFEQFAAVVNAAMVRQLKPRQMRDAFFLASMAHAGNFSVPGSGKTATVLGAFAFLAERGRVRRLLVVCPKNAFDSWKTEWELCFGAKRPLVCATTQDSAYKQLRRQDRQRFFRTGVAGCNLIIVNYEAAPGVADDLAQLAATETLLVFDEVHRVKRVGGTQAKAALAISSRAPYTFALTGTPLPNTYVDLYNFLHILYPREYDSFFGFDQGELKRADETDQLRINERIQPFFCRTTKADLGVPPAEVDKVLEVGASERTNRLVHVLRNRYRRNKLTLMLRILQMEHDPRSLLDDLDPAEYRWVLEEDEETGEVDTVDYSEEVVELIRTAGAAPKRERCLELVEELVRAGKPVIVWCIFVESMRGLVHDLAARGIEARAVYGEVAQDDRTRALDEFRAGAYPVLITNPHTLAESVSLHMVCHDAVYYEYSFNLVHLLQSKDRIHRLGLAAGQRTQYYYLCAEYGCGKGTGGSGDAGASAGAGDVTRHLDPDGHGHMYSMDRQIYDRLCMKEQTMLRAIDADLIETQPTTEEDLNAIFAGLFED